MPVIKEIKDVEVVLPTDGTQSNDPRDFLHGKKSRTVDFKSLPEGTDKYINRELSWLEFDQRVLEEARNQNVPLLERLRFLAISASNLDEFYTVRVAGLAALVRLGDKELGADQMRPSHQLTAIDARIRALIETQNLVWSELQKSLEAQSIYVVSGEEITAEDQAFLDDYFLNNVFPVLSPLTVDPAHPFPFIPSGGLVLALKLSQKNGKKKLDTLLPVPQQTARFIALPAPEGAYRFVALETVLRLQIEQIFNGFEVKDHALFRLLRDSDLEVEEEAEDLVREFEIALKRRRRGRVVRLKVESSASPSLSEFIAKNLAVSDEEVFFQDGIIGMADFSEIVSIDRPDLKFEPFAPRIPERVQDHGGDIFAAIRQKDMLLHHPYESFDIVVNFLRQAARDPNVLAIKQTLYRTSSNSPIVAALCEAAELGKSVTAMIELKARFDEATNIQLARQLERAGVHVVYGFIDWKTHAKLSTVVRREDDALQIYSHFGTGNYHPITANIYTDLSLFTVDKKLGRDAAKLFNYLSGYAEPEFEKLVIAPKGLKKHLIELIDVEIENARAGKPAGIWAKMNALVEPEVIDALYRASDAGVTIDLVVRGICSLRPGVKGLSENIRVKSIVGRFLEHSRVVCFANGHDLPSQKAKVFISSADWMGRNLNRRIESLVPVRNKTVRAQLLDQIMAANLADVEQSWMLKPDGTYLRGNTKTPGFNCHKYFMENPSLSGRGSVGKKDVHPLTDADLEEDPQQMNVVNEQS